MAFRLRNWERPTEGSGNRLSEQEMRSMLLECGALQEGTFADGEGRDLRYRVEMTRLYQQPGQMGRVMDAFAQRFASSQLPKRMATPTR